jgi:hypothetical protein
MWHAQLLYFAISGRRGLKIKILVLEYTPVSPVCDNSARERRKRGDGLNLYDVIKLKNESPRLGEERSIAGDIFNICPNNPGGGRFRC